MLISAIVVAGGILAGAVGIVISEIGEPATCSAIIAIASIVVTGYVVACGVAHVV